MRNRVLALAVVSLLALGLAWAGEQGKAGSMGPAEHAAKLKAKLGLSDTQTAQVQAVFEDIQKRHAELKAKGEPMAPEAKKKLKEERAARLKAILTAEQWARYQQMMAERAREHAQKP